jgi:hypothetical protein
MFGWLWHIIQSWFSWFPSFFGHCHHVTNGWLLIHMSLSSTVQYCSSFCWAGIYSGVIIPNSDFGQRVQSANLPRLQNLGGAEVTFKDEADEVIKLPASKLPELPKVPTPGWCGELLLLQLQMREMRNDYIRLWINVLIYKYIHSEIWWIEIDS